MLLHFMLNLGNALYARKNANRKQTLSAASFLVMLLFTICSMFEIVSSGCREASKRWLEKQVEFEKCDDHLVSSFVAAIQTYFP